MGINENIKKLRKERGMTLEELGKAAGVSKQTVQKYEKGLISNIPYDKIVLLAGALRVSPADLMGWEESSADGYYLNDEALAAAKFLHNNPEYRVLFDAVRNVSADDIDFVRQMIDRTTGKND